MFESSHMDDTFVLGKQELANLVAVDIVVVVEPREEETAADSALSWMVEGGGCFLAFEEVIEWSWELIDEGVVVVSTSLMKGGGSIWLLLLVEKMRALEMECVSKSKSLSKFWCRKFYS